jgi:hypothetical protein
MDGWDGTGFDKRKWEKDDLIGRKDKPTTTIEIFTTAGKR